MIKSVAAAGLVLVLLSGMDAVEAVSLPEGFEPVRHTVDTTGIYYHLRHGNIPTAKKELERLKRENPGWTPPEEMLQLFHHDPPKTDPYQKQLGELAQITPEGAVSIPGSTLADMAAAIKQRQDAEGAVILGWLYYHRGETGVARALFESARKWGAVEKSVEGLKHSCYREASEMLKSKETDAAVSAAICSSENGRADAFESLGWQAMEQKLFEGARQLFSMKKPETEAVIYGQFLALHSLKRFDESERFACDHAARSKRLRDACVDAVAKGMVLAYKADHYEQVLSDAGYLDTLNYSRSDLEALEAWAALKLERYDHAAMLFEKLLAQDPKNRDFAAGLAQSLPADSAALRSARSTYPVLERYFRHGGGDIAYARKQFDRARGLERAPFRLRGREGWQVETGGAWRERSGTRGLSQLESHTPYVAVTGVVRGYRVLASVVAPTLYSGRPADDDAFGNRPVPDIQKAPDRAYGVSPKVGVRREMDAMNLFCILGTTPSGFEVEEAVVGEVGARWFRDPWIPSLRLFSRANGESLLAYAGTRDTTSKKTWGRVIEQGIGGQLVYLRSAANSMTLSGEYSNLVGKGVRENGRAFIRGDYTWDLSNKVSLPETDYCRIGPFVSSMSYRKNLSHFTLGHGGYYSPQVNQQLGVSLDWLSSEGKKRQFRVKTALAYEDAKVSRTPYFPLDDNGDRYEGSVSSGVAVNAQVEGVWLVGKGLQLGGYAGHISSDGYDEHFVGFMVRVPFSKQRQVLVSSDLPLWQLSD